MRLWCGSRGLRDGPAKGSFRLDHAHARHRRLCLLHSAAVATRDQKSSHEGYAREKRGEEGRSSHHVNNSLTVQAKEE